MMTRATAGGCRGGLVVLSWVVAVPVWGGGGGGGGGGAEAAERVRGVAAAALHEAQRRYIAEAVAPRDGLRAAKDACAMMMMR
jgi:hypothetical protein